MMGETYPCLEIIFNANGGKNNLDVVAIFNHNASQEDKDRIFGSAMESLERRRIEFIDLRFGTLKTQVFSPEGDWFYMEVDSEHLPMNKQFMVRLSPDNEYYKRRWEWGFSKGGLDHIISHNPVEFDKLYEEGCLNC